MMREQQLAGTAFILPRLKLDVDQARQTLLAAKRKVQAGGDKASLREARRAVTKASVALAKAEAAVVAEQRGEEAAPAVRRQEIAMGALVLREPQVQMVGKRAELTPALERLHSRGTIDRACYQAGRRYREAYEAAGLDLYPIGLGGDGGRSAPQSGNRRVEDAVAMSQELQAARRCIGKFGSAMLEHVVVEGLTLASYAERQGQSEHVVKGVLIMVLTRLAEHWETIDAAR